MEVRGPARLRDTADRQTVREKIATLGLMENTQAELYPSKVRRGSRQITEPMV